MNNINALRKNIPSHVQLVAVSKTVEEGRLREALQAGQRVFAENYVQEAKAKWPALRVIFPDIHVRLIGHLQSNKAGDAVALFDRIDTLDRPKLAYALAKEMHKQQRFLPVLIEVNIGAEPQKGGVLPQDFSALLALARDSLKLDVQGLMCIPPEGQNPKSYFEQCASLARAHGLAVISMGMSADYDMAIACGATEVRLGTALFGQRP